MAWRQQSWRRSLILLLIEGGLLLGLVGGIVWLNLTIQSARRALDAREQQATQSLAGVSAQSKLRAELDTHQAAIQQIIRLAPHERAIGEVVAAIEREAAGQDVVLHVPLVEAVDETETGQTPGILRDVHLQLIVSGEPAQVISFFHAVEHLPYLVRVGAWELTTKEEQPVPESAAFLPTTGPPAGRKEITQPSGAELTLEVFLSIADREQDEAES